MDSAFSMLLIELYEQETYGSPNQLSDSDDECYENTSAGCESKARNRHQETSFPTSQLQRHEEQQIGEKCCKGNDEDTIKVIHTGEKHQKNEINLQSTEYTTHQLRQHNGKECLSLLIVQRCDLVVDVSELLIMLNDISFGPFPRSGYIPQQPHHSHRQAFLVP